MVPVMKPDLSIAVIGAGMAGLTAGLELSRAGYPVTIFEARERSGGRIHSIHYGEHVLETGPEFIHGHLRETLRLLKKYNITYVPVRGKMYHAKNGKLDTQEEMIEGWDIMLKKMNSLKDDMSFRVFLDLHFPESSFTALRQSARRFAEGFDLANTEEASTRALAMEWNHGESEQYLIPVGYSSLTDAMEDEFRSLGGKVFFNCPVREINGQPDSIRIWTDTSEYTARYGIITVSLSSFHSKRREQPSLIVTPEDPEMKMAMEKIGFGTVVKVLLVCTHSFWEEKAPDALFFFSDFFFPTWWTGNPTGLSQLTGWLGGPAAEKFSLQPDSFFRDKALESLSEIFSLPTSMLQRFIKDIRVFNWSGVPWTYGGYSYARPGYREAKSFLRKPLLDKIFLAGEATYDGPHPGTVEAALISGQLVAEKLLIKLKEN